MGQKSGSGPQDKRVKTRRPFGPTQPIKSPEGGGYIYIFPDLPGELLTPIIVLLVLSYIPIGELTKATFTRKFTESCIYRFEQFFLIELAFGIELHRSLNLNSSKKMIIQVQIYMFDSEDECKNINERKSHNDRLDK